MLKGLGLFLLIMAFLLAIADFQTLRPPLREVFLAAALGVGLAGVVVLGLAHRRTGDAE